MPEGVEAPVHFEKPKPPLSPELDADPKIQQKIIGYLGTADFSVLKLPYYPLTVIQKTEFDTETRKEDPERSIRYRIQAVRRMLMAVDSPLEGEDSQDNYAKLTSRISDSKDDEQRITSFLGKPESSRLAPSDIALFLIQNPTPIEADEYLTNMLDLIGSDAGEAELEKIGESVRVFFEGIYGERFKYWQNYKLLADAANNSHKETNDKRRKPQMHLKGVRKQAAVLGLAAVGVFTGVAGMDMSHGSVPSNSNAPVAGKTLDNSSQPTPESTSQPTPQPTPETERAKLEREIEEKYGIELLNQREGNERRGRKLNEADEGLTGETLVLRWSEKQIRNADYLLGFMPSKMISAKNGIPLGISLWDFGSENEAYGWAHLGNTEDMISLYQDAFASDSLEDQMSLLSHELLHMNDNEDLKIAVEGVLGDRSFFNNQVFQSKEEFVSHNKDNFDAMMTLGSFKDGEKPHEGRAGFGQLYVRGYERFMKALGPGLDGGEFDSTIPREKLADRYPKTQAIYDIYLEVFDGKEFDEIARELNPNFSYGVFRGNGENVSISEDYFDKVWKEFGASHANDKGKEWTQQDMEILYKTLKALPPSLHTLSSRGVKEGKILTFVKGEEDSWRNNPDAVLINDNAFDSKVDAFVEIGSELVKRSEAYEAAIDELTIDYNIENRGDVGRLLNSISKLYLKGTDVYVYGSEEIVDKFIQTHGVENSKNFRRMITQYVHSVFQGHGFVVNDGSLTVMTDSNIFTFDWD